MRSARAVRQFKLRSYLAVPCPQRRGVDGETECFASGGLGPPNLLASELAIGLYVQLEPQRRRRDATDFLDRRRRGRTDDPCRVRRAGAARGGELAVVVHHALIGGGGKKNRKGVFLPEERDPRVRLRDVRQN